MASLVGKNTTGNTNYTEVTIGCASPGTYGFPSQVIGSRADTFTRMTIKKLGAYTYYDDLIKLGLYSQSGGAPNALVVAEAEISTSPEGWAWHWRTLSPPYYANGVFHMSSNSNITTLGNNSSGGALWYGTFPYATAWPDPRGSVSTDALDLDLRAVCYRGKGFALGTRFQAVCSGNGITFYVYFALGSSGSFRVVLYNDAGVHPTTKIVASSSKTIIPGQWNAITIVSSAIADGVYYWPLFQFDNAAALPHRETGVSGSKSFYYAMDYGEFPADLTGLGTVESDAAASLWSIYVSQDFNPPPPAPNTWGFAEGSNCFIVDHTEDYREIATMIILKGGKDEDDEDICVVAADEDAATQYGKRVSVFSESQWTSVAMAELRGIQLLSVKKLPAITITIEAPAYAVRVGDIATLVSPTLGVNSNFIIQSVDFQKPGDTPMVLQLTSIVPTILDFLNLIQRNLEKR